MEHLSTPPPFSQLASPPRPHLSSSSSRSPSPAVTQRAVSPAVKEAAIIHGGAKLPSSLSTWSPARSPSPARLLVFRTPVDYVTALGGLLIVLLMTTAFLLGGWSGSLYPERWLDVPYRDLRFGGGMLRLEQLESFLLHFNMTCAEAKIPVESVRQEVLNGVYNGTSPYVDFPPPAMEPLLRKSRVKGWGSTDAVFRDLMKEVMPEVVLELGTFLGASAIHMAGVATELGLKPVILCVDDFRGWVGFQQRFGVAQVNGQVLLLYQFLQNAIAYGFQEMLLPVPFSVDHTTRTFCEWGLQADLIEVDAGHTFISAWSDINTAYPLLSPKGVMFGHDYAKKAVRHAVDLFARVQGLRVEVNDQHWILRKPLKP